MEISLDTLIAMLGLFIGGGGGAFSLGVTSARRRRQRHSRPRAVPLRNGRTSTSRRLRMRTGVRRKTASISMN